MLAEAFFVALVLLHLVALGASVPVLRGIVRDGLERQRNWQTGELTRYEEDEEYGVPPDARPADPSGTATCPECGSENRAGFTFCRSCGECL